MGYSEILKQLFAGIKLHAEDLLHLESFQIKDLSDRIPQKEFSILLRKYPFIQRFLISKQPSIKNFINTILKENKAINEKNEINKHCDELLWEIADLIVYNKFPEIYDEKVDFRWDIKDIISKGLLKNKVENPFHKKLISTDWKYDCSNHQDTAGLKLKYFKTLT